MTIRAFCCSILIAASGGSALAQSSPKIDAPGSNDVSVPGNPEVPSAAAAAAPSDRKTPGELVDGSIGDLSNGQVTAAVHDDIKALRRGPLLIHGNYCGIGNRPGTPPVDLLDEACMRHDACTHTGKLPSCTCDNRLHDEAFAIAQDPRTPADLKVLATGVAASMVVLICK